MIHYYSFHIFSYQYFFIHRGEAVLRKHLQTFEENQKSNIIRRTKGKRTLIKFINFTAPKSTWRDTHKSRKPFFPTWKQQKTHLFQQKTWKKLRKKFFSKFSEIFLWRSPVNRTVPKILRSLLRSQNVSFLLKIKEGLRWKQILKKSRIEKTPGPE